VYLAAKVEMSMLEPLLLLHYDCWSLVDLVAVELMVLNDCPIVNTVGVVALVDWQGLSHLYHRVLLVMPRGLLMLRSALLPVLVMLVVELSRHLCFILLTSFLRKFKIYQI
jgi:hypothetical protein